MLSRSQAKIFFLAGTILASTAFIALTAHSFQQIPRLSNQDEMTPMVIRGKHLWDESNCMGCHTLLGEGGYYAPELTKVYERRGPAFIRAMLEDPQGMYPGQRKMYEYDLTDDEIEAFIAFFQWIGNMDLNGFPPEPVLFGMATSGSGTLVQRDNRPQVFNQMCVACHALGGQGGEVGPSLDGIGDRMIKEDIEVWLTDPQQVKPGTAMPDLPLDENQIRELAAFLSTLRSEPGPEGAPPPGSPEAETQGPDVPPEPSDANPDALDTETQEEEEPQPSPTGTEEGL